MWDKASTILEKKVRKRGKSEILMAALVCYLAGKIKNGEFWPVSFKDGVLTLKTESSSASSDVLARKEEIIQKINKKVGKEVVKKIKLKVVS